VQTRAVRQRVVNNENDENITTTRLTRAKAAALSVEDIAGSANVQKPLQTKKSSLNSTAQPRAKRAALGDVSNVTKGDAVESKDGKKATGRQGLVTKVSQQAGVHKGTTRAAPKPVPVTRDVTKKSTTTRSGPGAIGTLPKKRSATSTTITQSIKEEPAAEEGEPQRKKAHTAEEKALKKEELKEAKETRDAREIREARETREREAGELREVREREAREIREARENREEPAVQEKTKTIVQQFEEAIPDLDAEDIDDPLMVAEYVVEIFEYLKELELATMPNADYMDHQEDLEWKMRGILVDWLIEVHTRFHLLPETLFLAVNIIDRFLTAKVVQLDRLQLVGVTAMFIASKYEEVLSPHVANFRHVADDGFTEAEILSAERYVLSALNYDLSYPNPMNFLRRISKADNYDIQTRTLGKYLMEISLLDHRFMSYLPSHVAASSMYLARMILERGEWDSILTHYSGYSEEEIEPVFKLMVDYLARPVVHEAFFKKYASKKFLKGKLHIHHHT
jgi:hypothetical protein